MFVIKQNLIITFTFIYRFMSKKILQLLQNSCYESFCSALVHDISRDELKIAEKVPII